MKIWRLWQENWRYLISSLHRSSDASSIRTLGAASNRDIRRLLGGQVRRHWKMIAIVLGCLLAAAFGELAMPMLSGFMIDKALIPRNFKLFLPILGLLAAAYLISGFAQTIQSFVSGRLQQRISLGLKEDLTAHLLRLPGDFFDRVSGGYLAGRVVGDVRSLSTFFGIPMQNFVSSVIKLVCAEAQLFYLSWKLGLGVLCMVPLLFVAARVFGRRQYVLNANCSEGTSGMVGKLQETFTNIKLVKSSAAEEGALDELRHRYEHLYQLNMEITALTALFQRLMRWLPDICRAGVLLVTCWWVMRGEWSVGQLLAVNMLMMMVLNPTRTLAFSLVQMASAKASLARLSSLLALVPEENLKTGLVPERLAGRVEFKNVRFGYLPDRTVLRDLSFEIPPGKMTALVGASGAGKSTLVSLIMHFYAVPEGEVLIDGVNVNAYNLPALRRRIGCLGADAKLFSDTLAANLRLGRAAATDAELAEALRQVGLDELLAKGLDFHLEEEGKNLSAGQKLRVALARELLRDADILILDEPTSALDRRTEILVADAVKKYAAGHTVVVVTHREHFARLADKVVYLDDRTVAGEGSYDELSRRFGPLCSSTEE
ncbi:MAG: ABC transporter ATP-binding protein [Victivallaceae bacterium]|nr:ABC transporter ATP-binding protein [Victivallaceae bacterium]